MDTFLDETEVAGEQLVEFIGDHDTAHVQLQVALLLVVVLFGREEPNAR